MRSSRHRSSGGRGAFVTLMVAGLLLACLLAAIDDRVPIVGLAVHFRWQLLLVSVVLLLLISGLRRWGAAAIVFACLLFNLWPVLPVMLAEKPQQVRRDLTVTTFNMYRGLADQAALLAYLDQEKSDLLLLTEMPEDPEELEVLQAKLARLYPHRLSPSPVMLLDVALFSRWPLQNGAYNRELGRWMPVLHADVCPPADIPAGKGGCINFVGLHGAQPLADSNHWQEQQFRVAAAKIQAADGRPSLLAGDLNMTRWSRLFRILTGEDEEILQDSSLGYAPWASWQSSNPLLGLPIDHVLISKHFRVGAHQVGPDLGSDHRPVTVHLERKP